MSTELDHLRDLIVDNIVDVADLVSLLELTIEDIIDAFPHFILQNKDKFMLEVEEYETHEDTEEESIDI